MILIIKVGMNFFFIQFNGKYSRKKQQSCLLLHTHINCVSLTNYDFKKLLLE